MRERLDTFDRKILTILQENGSAGPQELSERIHLSPSQCSRRLQRLRDEGYIERIAAILRPERLNLGVSAYVAVSLRAHSAEAERRFKERVEQLPEVVSCDYLTGEIDFILRVHTRDLETYSRFLTDKLIDDAIANIRTSIILKRLKDTTTLMLDYC